MAGINGFHEAVTTSASLIYIITLSRELVIDPLFGRSKRVDFYQRLFSSWFLLSYPLSKILTIDNDDYLNVKSLF